MSSILDLDELLTRIAQLTKRVIDYRTFGILLLNEATNELEMKLALQYGEQTTRPAGAAGARAWSATRRCTRRSCSCPTCRPDPRYIKLVDDVRSELVIPLLVKDRCIGVFDLESPELDAFTKSHVEMLTLLASQAAVAIENARLYETIRANEERLEKELRFAQRVQAALLPTELPKRMKGVDVAARFAPARELGGDLYDFLSPEANTPGRRRRRRVGQGRAGRALQRVRGRAGPLAHVPPPLRAGAGSAPAGVLSSMNTILHERQLEEYYCTLCYAVFDLKRRTVTLANSGLPYPIRCSGDACAPIELAGVPLGSFAGLDLRRGVASTCTPGDLLRVLHGRRVRGDERGGARSSGRRACSRSCARRARLPAREIVDRIFAAVRGLPRRRTAERRHDGGGGQDHQLKHGAGGAGGACAKGASAGRGQRGTARHGTSTLGTLSTAPSAPTARPAPPARRRSPARRYRL